MDTFSAVIVFDEGEGQAGYAVLAHNLQQYEADRLAHRLDKQYEFTSFVIAHSIYHSERDATQCVGCANLMGDVVEKAIAHAKGKSRDPQ